MSYVELHSHSSYSFCDGASLPEELAARAADYGYEAFALTDHDNVCGAMELAQACAGLGVRPIHGAEVNISPGMLGSASAPGGAGARDGETFHLTVLVESAVGWHNLCRLLTEAHAETRPRPDRDPLPPCWRSTRCWSETRASSASPAARATERSPAPGSAASRAERRSSRGRFTRPSAPSASASSCSGRCGGATAAATAGWPGSRSGSAWRPSPPETSTPTTAPGPSCRTRWWPCAPAPRSRSPSPIAAATRARCSRRRLRSPPASPSTRRRLPRRHGSPNGCASTSPPSSATATRARRTPRPIAPWPRSAAGD